MRHEDRNNGRHSGAISPHKRSGTPSSIYPMHSVSLFNGTVQSTTPANNEVASFASLLESEEVSIAPILPK